jgi:hypothetical protein
MITTLLFKKIAIFPQKICENRRRSQHCYTRKSPFFNRKIVKIITLTPVRADSILWKEWLTQQLLTGAIGDDANDGVSTKPSDNVRRKTRLRRRKLFRDTLWCRTSKMSKKRECRLLYYWPRLKAHPFPEPIVRLMNLQLQRRRLSSLEHFSKQKKNLCYKNALGYPKRCNFTIACRIGSRC